MKTEMEVTAEAVAAAIHATRKFTAAEHGAAVGTILTSGLDAAQMQLAISRIANVSAVYQKLVKAGIIQGSDYHPGAWELAVKSALAKLDAAKH
ncbi:MAG: hypothetical protein KGL39_41440 [Patescibacteria group bacterium]|nr:hypothetical protein [Patescibacteria group bacterium]